MTVLDNDISIYNKKDIENLSTSANELINAPLQILASKCKIADDNTLNIALKTLSYLNSQEERKAIIESQIADNAKATDMAVRYSRF